MIKKLVLVLLAAVALYGAIASPYSLVSTLDRKAALEAAVAEKDSAEAALNNSRSAYVNAANAFESQRTFTDVHADLQQMKALLDAVTGISFAGLYEADPNMNFALGAPADPEAYPSGTPLPVALCLQVVAEDTAAGLRIIEKMELPVQSIVTTEPGRIDVIFLTGGDS